MNFEMFEFALHVAGVDDIPEVLHMKAPYGETVLNPRTRGHVGEIARRFPRSVYSYHPELTRPALSSWMWSRTMESARIFPRFVAPLAVGILIHTGLKLWLGETDRSGYREPTTQERIDAYTTIPQYASRIDAYRSSHYGRV